MALGKLAMDDVLEALLYLFSFWRFVFSRQFRAERIAKFRSMNTPRKCLEILVGLIATVVGLGLPALIIICCSSIIS